MRTIKDKYIKPAFTELSRKQEVFIDPVSGESTKTNNYYSAKRKFLNNLCTYTELAFNPDLKVDRQKSSYHPFTIKTANLDRCPNQKTIRQMVHGKYVHLVVPCGKCVFCQHKKQNELILRCRNEYKTSKSSIFVTLTYNNNNLKYGTEGYKRLDYTDIQHFIKRLRSLFKDRKGFNLDFRYLVCGEYGTCFGRPHYHLIFFLKHDIDVIEFLSYIVNSWQLGYVYPRVDKCKPEDLLCTLNSIAYATKYTAKYDEKGQHEYPQFIKWSKGLGKDYVLNNPLILKEYRDKNRISYTNVKENGKLKEYSVSLPIYYRNLVFRPAERFKITEDYLNSLQYANQCSIMLSQVLFDHLQLMGKKYEVDAKQRLEAKRLAKLKKMKFVH